MSAPSASSERNSQGMVTGPRWHLSAPDDPAVLAAAVAAIQAMWPTTGANEDPPEPSRWRFSARWWARGRATVLRRPHIR